MEFPPGLAALVLLAVVVTRPSRSAVEQLDIPGQLRRCFCERFDAKDGHTMSASHVMHYCLQLHIQKEAASKQDGNETRSSWIVSLLARSADFRNDTAVLAVRKEYRSLSDDERENFHRAVNLLKNDTSVKPNKYDSLAMLHRGTAAENAHGGPSFLIWHRIYIRLFEEALQEMVPSVTVPYWDITADSMLDDPATSNIWGNEFIGNGNGLVTTGPFANWETPEGPLIRDRGRYSDLPTKSKIDDILNAEHYGEITEEENYDTNLEMSHNNIHMWVGGILADLANAPFDPLFYLIHCFIDYVWYRFHERQRKLGFVPELDYPSGYENTTYDPDRTIGLKRLTVKQALVESLYYTNYTYTYDHGHTKECTNDYGCSSKYFKCVNKVCLPRSSKKAAGSETLDSIQNNFCIDGRCDIDRWVFMPVQILYRRPDDGMVFDTYVIKNSVAIKVYDVYDAKQYTAYNPISANQSRLKCHRRHCCNSASPVLLETDGLSYHGTYKDVALVDQRYAISSTTAYVAVKAPEKHVPTLAMVFATDSCGRVCEPFLESAPCSGFLNITVGETPLYGRNLAEVYMSASVKKNQLLLREPVSNILTFYCDSDTWPESYMCSKM